MSWLWWALVGCGAVDVDAEVRRPPPPALTATVVAGRLQLDVVGAIPGTTVYFAGSLLGPGAGPCPAVLSGQCLGIRGPVLIGQRAIGVAGTASLNVALPAGVSVGWAQAAMAAGVGSLTSNVAEFARERTVADLGPGDLVITEVMFNPSAVADSVGEWFEIFNPGTTAVDLSGLLVRDDRTDAFLVPAGVIPAGGRFVMGASVDTAVNGGAAVDRAWSSTALANGPDVVVLEANGLEIDRVAWDGGPTWPATAGASMSLDPGSMTAAGNDTPTAWCVATSPYGLGDRGTPRAANPSCGGGGGGADVDADGFGDTVDCDDRDPRTHPGAAEVCDGKDNDCSGAGSAAEADLDADGMPDCDPCQERGWRSAVSGIGSPSQARTVLGGLAAAQTCGSYSDARDDVFTLVDYDAGEAECVYTGVRVPVPSGPPDHTVMNIEHTWPRSLGTSAPPMECDMHHLFPSDSDANAERGNLPFGDVTGTTFWAAGGSARGFAASGAEVFEPRDAHKGNAARAMLYMSVRHGLSLTAAEIDLFQAWDLADPVDAAELQRTLEVGALQGAPNPLVVCDGAAQTL